MKVLFLTGVYPDENGFIGGVFTHNQAVALKDAGHDVAVMFTDFRSIRKKRSWFRSKYKLDGVAIYRWAFPCGPIPAVINIVSKWLVKSLYNYTIKDFGTPDIIYAHFGSSGIDANEIRKKYGIPYAVVEHDSGILSGSTDKKLLEKRKVGYNNAFAVIAVGESLKKELQKYTVNQVEVVPNIIPEYMFGDKGINKANSSDYLFISIGNLIERKSFDMTIKGFAKVVEKHKNARLLIVGIGPLETELRQLVDKLGVKDRIRFLGQVNNRKLAMIMRGCDCFVLPSKFETFGVVYVEAMACGLPVIATRCGGPEDYINEENGVLIDVGEEDQLVRAMCEMIEGIREYSGSQIRAKVKDSFSGEVIVERLEHIFSYGL